MSSIIGILNKLQVTAEGTLEKITAVSACVGAGILTVWIFVFTGCIIARSLFHASQFFLEEYTGYWTLIITCLALAYTFRREGHIRVDFVIQKLSQRVRLVIEVFVTFIAFIVSSIIFAYGMRLLLFAIKQNVHSTYGATPLWPVYLWIPVGYGLLSLALLIYFFRNILALLKGK